MYMRKIKNGFTLNQLAQKELTKLFLHGEGCLDFIFEQVVIIYRLSTFTGSHDVNNKAREALKTLLWEYTNESHKISSKTAVACSVALSMGIKVMVELPRSEYLLAHTESRKLSESRESILNYLRLFQ